MAADMEMLQLFDEQDEPAGAMPRWALMGRDDVCVHRVQLIIHDREHAMLLRRRAEADGQHRWGVSVRGYVREGELLIDTARRLLEGELGIRDVVVSRIGDLPLTGAVGGVDIILATLLPGREELAPPQVPMSEFSWQSPETVDRALTEHPDGIDVGFALLWERFRERLVTPQG